MYKSVTVHSRSTYWTNREANDELIVDSVDLAREIENVSNKLYRDGYEVIAITPISSGTISNGNGYFQTADIIITAKAIKK